MRGPGRRIRRSKAASESKWKLTKKTSMMADLTIIWNDDEMMTVLYALVIYRSRCMELRSQNRIMEHLQSYLQNHLVESTYILLSQAAMAGGSNKKREG